MHGQLILVLDPVCIINGNQHIEDIGSPLDRHILHRQIYNRRFIHVQCHRQSGRITGSSPSQSRTGHHQRQGFDRHILIRAWLHDNPAHRRVQRIAQSRGKLLRLLDFHPIAIHLAYNK